MKQGTNFILPVSINYDLSLVEKIEFIFKQDENHCKHGHATHFDNEKVKTFEYPSDSAILADDISTIQLKWTVQDTFIFDPECTVYMDTRIHLKDSEENPETTIVKIKMKPTLFENDSC